MPPDLEPLCRSNASLFSSFPSTTPSLEGTFDLSITVSLASSKVSYVLVCCYAHLIASNRLHILHSPQQLVPELISPVYGSTTILPAQQWPPVGSSHNQSHMLFRVPTSETCTENSHLPHTLIKLLLLKTLPLHSSNWQQPSLIPEHV